MRRDALGARRPKGRVRRPTDSFGTTRIAPILLGPDFSTEWVSNITYNAIDQGWLYLCVVLDLSNRGGVGYAMSKNIDAVLVGNAVTAALKQRGYPRGLLFHSDRGSQYASDAVVNLLAGNGIHTSMSRRGNSCDNAVCESFFGTLKREMNAAAGFQSYREAELLIFEYIEIFYNRKRRHSGLG